MKKIFMVIIPAALMLIAAAFTPLGQESKDDSDGPTVVYFRQTDSGSHTVNSAGAVAEAKLWPKQEAYLGFAGAGIVESVFVKEGDAVREGDVLAVIKGSENYRLQYAEAELNLAAAQDELKSLNDQHPTAKAETYRELVEARKALDKANDDYADYDTPSYRTRIDNANEAYTDKWEEVEDAKEKADKVSDLAEGSTRRQQVEDDYKRTLQDYEELERAYRKLLNDKDAAAAAVQTAEARIADLERELDEMADGPKAEKLSIINQKIAAAEAQKTAAEKNIEQLQIIAPFDGTVVSMDLTAGELATAAKPVIVLADTGEMILKTVDLSETDITGINVGNRVRVIFDAYPDQEFGGTVTKITNWAGAYLGDVVFPVEVTLDDSSLPFLWGMTASVYF